MTAIALINAAMTVGWDKASERELQLSSPVEFAHVSWEELLDFELDDEVFEELDDEAFEELDEEESADAPVCAPQVEPMTIGLIKIGLMSFCWTVLRSNNLFLKNTICASISGVLGSVCIKVSSSCLVVAILVFTWSKVISTAEQILKAASTNTASSTIFFIIAKISK